MPPYIILVKFGLTSQAHLQGLPLLKTKSGIAYKVVFMLKMIYPNQKKTFTKIPIHLSTNIYKRFFFNKR